MKTKNNNKKILIALSITGVSISIIYIFSIIELINIFLIDNPLYFYLGFIITSLLMILSALLSLYIETRLGYFECPSCKNKFTPTFKAIFLGPHKGKKRKLVCPKCHKKEWMKQEL